MKNYKQTQEKTFPEHLSNRSPRPHHKGSNLARPQTLEDLDVLTVDIAFSSPAVCMLKNGQSEKDQPSQEVARTWSTWDPRRARAGM